MCWLKRLSCTSCHRITEAGFVNCNPKFLGKPLCNKPPRDVGITNYIPNCGPHGCTVPTWLAKVEMPKDMKSTISSNGSFTEAGEAVVNSAMGEDGKMTPQPENIDLWNEMEALSACALALEKAAEKSLAQHKEEEEEEKKSNKKKEDEIVQAVPGPVAVINEVTTNIQAPAPQTSDQVA